MKIYSIDTPEKLREAAGMIKWERDRKKTQEVINAWMKGYGPEKVTLEVSRNAHIFTHQDGKKTLLATMYVQPARKWAAEALGGCLGCT